MCLWLAAGLCRPFSDEFIVKGSAVKTALCFCFQWCNLYRIFTANIFRIVLEYLCFSGIIFKNTGFLSQFGHLSMVFKEPLNQSSAAADGSFAPAMQFEKLEMHPVFLRFPNFYLWQNFSASALADLIRASLKKNPKSELM